MKTLDNVEGILKSKHDGVELANSEENREGCVDLSQVLDFDMFSNIS